MTYRRAVEAALFLFLADIAAASAQELPRGGGPLPELRRGANGQIEVVPTAPAPRSAPMRPNDNPSPAVVTPNSGAAKPTHAAPPPPVPVAAPPALPAGPARPVIEIQPGKPRVPDTALGGTVVASYSVRMSDNSPFTGTVRFGPPYYDDNGKFALDGTRIIVSRDGPGIGPNKTTVTNRITLEAVPENRVGR